MGTRREFFTERESAGRTFEMFFSSFPASHRVIVVKTARNLSSVNEQQRDSCASFWRTFPASSVSVVIYDFSRWNFPFLSYFFYV